MEVVAPTGVVCLTPDTSIRANLEAPVILRRNSVDSLRLNLWNIDDEIGHLEYVHARILCDHVFHHRNQDSKSWAISSGFGSPAGRFNISSILG